MASPSREAIPLKLPPPPSIPPVSRAHDRPNGSRADRALAPAPDALDVHVRWAVASGDVVQKGARLATLWYARRGAPPPPVFGSGSVPASEGYVAEPLLAGVDGFVRVLYARPVARGAVRIHSLVPPRYSVVDLNLAAVEPCEHPAVVGGLCVVCGADTRAPSEECVRTKEPTANVTHQPMLPMAERRTSVAQHIRPTKALNTQEQKIIEKQMKLAAMIATSNESPSECLDDDDTELASFNVDAAVAARDKAPLRTVEPPRAPRLPAVTRSLSSLLSGAQATQQMQHTSTRKPLPRQRPVAAVARRALPRVPSPLPADGPPSAAATNMSKVTVSGGVTITISAAEAQNIAAASSRKLREEKKLCLVLDLDHTLLHATDDYRAGRFVAAEVLVDRRHGTGGEGDDAAIPSDSRAPATQPNHEKRADVRAILLPVELPPAQRQQYVQQKMQQQRLADANFCLPPLPPQPQNAGASVVMRHFVKLRPHLKEFFEQIRATYQLSVYTAGTRSYAEQVAIMICRHLVGATMDEEELNELRGKVRETEKQYRDFKARIGRKQQLELAKKWGMEEEKEGGEGERNEGKGAPKKKSVTFGQHTTNEGQNQTKEGAQSHSSKKPPNSNSKKDGNAPNAAKYDEHKSVSSSLPHEQKPPGNAATQIPRKRKLESSGSLLSLLPVKTVAPREKNGGVKEPPLIDPSEARDRLRKELTAAEKLEIAAVELRRKMFGSRIVSRTDVGDLGKDVKSLTRVFPCGGEMAAILDDREDVWANAENNVTGRPGEPPDNLMLVKPYHWKPFRGYADINNSSGNDLSKTDDDSSPANSKSDDKEDDVQLLWTADILRRLHERYYSTNSEDGGPSSLRKKPRTVPSLLQAMRRETLLRYPPVKLVFSGLIPINKQIKSDVRPPVIRYAEELGASVLSGVSREVTHIVAARDGSEKIKQARKEVPGCYIVHTAWLMECFWSISRRDVRPHHMGPMPKSRHTKRHASTRSKEAEPPSLKPVKRKSANDNILQILESDEDESEDDESEDDFAADLEKEMMQ